MAWHRGDPGTSPEQEAALGILRGALSDIDELTGKDGYYFQRWLRIRDFNAQQAERMIRKHIRVRRKLSVDTILTDYIPPEVLRRCFPGGFFGEDKEGHPVWYDNFGNLDVRGLYRSVKKEEFLKHKCYQGELCAQLCEQASVRKGHHIETFVMVIDLENLSLRKQYYWPGIIMIRDVTTMLEHNYPDRVGKIIIIKAPVVFPLAYNVIKHFIDEKTERKISILRGDSWKEELQRYISPDQLPEAYGGTRREPDPYCTKYINPGCDVPTEYYLSNCMENSKEEMERVVVGRASSHLITHHVDTPGTILRWEFVSVSYDIGYGWCLESGERERTEIVPVKRVKSHIFPESSSLTCDRAGNYVLTFDNSYSWFHSKEVFYCVKVVPPELSETTPTQTGSNAELEADVNEHRHSP